MSDNPYATPQAQPLPREPAYGSPYGGFRSTDVWLGMIMIFFAIYILLDAASVYTSWRKIQFYSANYPDFESPEYFFIEKCETLLENTYLVMAFVLAFIWCFWTNLACKNAWLINSRDGATALYRGRESFTPTWAWAWHFIPILQFWKPFQAMTWIRDASQKSLGLRMGKLLGIWWGLWLLSAVVALSYGAALFSAKTSAELAMAERLNLVTLPIDMLAAGFAIAVAIRLTKIQKIRAQELNLI